MMRDEWLRSILGRLQSGELDLEGALGALGHFPSDDLGYAKLDTQRALRVGFPEIVYCAGKSPEQLRCIFERLIAGGDSVLGTRASEAHFDALRDLSPALRLDPVSRTASLRRGGEPGADAPRIAVVTAGTSDIPVAEEAAITAELFGNRVTRVYDVGVAGIHRLFARLEEIGNSDVVIAAAGMEGALASVIGGLVASPVVALPTSVGYGSSFGGLAALLAMLNSCSAGVTVVNIDNGFGAGYAASLMCRVRAARAPSASITNRIGTCALP